MLQPTLSSLRNQVIFNGSIRGIQFYDKIFFKGNNVLYAYPGEDLNFDFLVEAATVFIGPGL